MSRFDGDGDWDGPDTSGLFRSSQERALTSARGHRTLREMARALLEMPTRELIAGALLDVTWSAYQITAAQFRYWPLPMKGAEVIWGQTCAVGEYAVWKYMQRTGCDRLAALTAMAQQWDQGDSERDTIDCAAQAGMARTIAWLLGDENDNSYRSYPDEANPDKWRPENPAERWARMLRVVREQMDPATLALSYQDEAAIDAVRAAGGEA